MFDFILIYLAIGLVMGCVQIMMMDSSQPSMLDLAAFDFQKMSSKEGFEVGFGTAWWITIITITIINIAAWPVVWIWGNK